MYDQVTLGLNVDPYILSALKEDITSEDVSTNSVMPDPTPGSPLFTGAAFWPLFQTTDLI